MTNLILPRARKHGPDGEQLIRSAPDVRRKEAPRLKADDERKSGDRYARNVAITSEHMDDVGDIVRADGGDVSVYRTNPIVMLQHGRGMEFPVIGGNAIVERGMVEGVPGWIAKEWLFGDTPLGREINSLWNDMILRTTSIGFRPLEWRLIDSSGVPVNPEEPDAWDRVTGFEFTKWVLLEFSVVAIPANPHARRELDGLLGMKAASYFDLASLKAACSGCGGQEKAEPAACEAPVEVATAGSIGPGETAALTIADHGELPEAARLLKTISLERCPGCKGVNLYSRDAGAFLDHRRKDGPRCAGGKLDAATGPTLKTIAEIVRDKTRSESPLNRQVPAEAAPLLEALVAVADAKALPVIIGTFLAEAAECIKQGRVLSAETRRVLETALATGEDAVEQTAKLLDQMRGAARLLREYLAAADRDDSEEGKAAADPSPADGDDPLRDPRVLAACAALT